MRFRFFGTVLLSAVCFSLPALGAGDATKGAIVFHNHCDFCHSARVDDGDGNGPNLGGIVGRPAGAMPGFEYSAAMKGSGLTWNSETLGTFVQDPDRLVPGTKMARKFKPVGPEDVPDLIAYLESKSPATSPDQPPASH